MVFEKGCLKRNHVEFINRKDVQVHQTQVSVEVEFGHQIDIQVNAIESQLYSTLEILRHTLVDGLELLFLQFGEYFRVILLQLVMWRGLLAFELLHYKILDVVQLMHRVFVACTDLANALVDLVENVKSSVIDQVAFRWIVRVDRLLRYTQRVRNVVHGNTFEPVGKK